MTVQRMRLLAPPGAGKGIRTERLIARLEIPQISTGDMLRAAVAAGTELGERAEAIMERGEFVPDEVVIGVAEERLAQADAQCGLRLGAEAARGGLGHAERAVVRRGVRSPLRGYDPPALPTCPAVLRVSAGGAIVHGIPGSRTLAEDDVESLDFGVEFGGCLAGHGEHGVLLTDHGPETLTPVRGLEESAGEIEK